MWNDYVSREPGVVVRTTMESLADCLEEFLDAYIEAADIAGDKKGPLFRTANRRTKQLTDRTMTTADAWAMVRRRAKDADIQSAIDWHTFRAPASRTTCGTAARWRRPKRY